MKKFAKKFTFMMLASALTATAFVGCSGEEKTEKPATENNGATEDKKPAEDKDTAAESSGTIVIASAEFNGVFSPFFYTTAYDNTIISRVHEGLLTLNPQGEIIGNLADYTIEEVKEGDEITSTIYTLTLKEDLVFSDGEPITSDDVIFSLKVLCDPTYDGMATFSTLPIIGMDEFKNGDATEIAGIEKVDDRTVKVTIEGIDPSVITKIGVSVMPEHYYGADYEKGKLEGVKAVNGQPMGAGPYTFESYKDNVVTLKVNPNYFKGMPKTATLKYQVVDEANKLEALKSELADISDPSASPEMYEMAENAGVYPELIDNPGYGYIGLNKDRIQDTNVRKGLMHLMNRGPAIEAYYGDLAKVIERPMTTVSWAYPQDAEEFYGYSPEKALEYFTAAGYTNEGGKLMKDGKQLRIEVGISDIATHPSGPILTQMKSDMESMGAVLEIMDSDGAVFFDTLNSEGWDMFVAAWGAALDPDMYQIFHTEGSTSRYNINNPELDKLIEDARKTNDTELRKEIYSDALDIVMDEAVIMPVYQRMNMYVFNPNYVDIDSLPEEMTPYYDFTSDIQNLQAVK